MLIKTGIKAIQDLKIAGRVSADEKLENYTTLKIGGLAEIFIQPFFLEDLREIVTFVKENGVPLFILGGGSKVLIPDAGLKGVIIKLDTPDFKKISFSNGFVRLGCGIKVNEFLNWMMQNSYGGWEFLAGIPAGIAGAVILNAGVRENPAGSKYIQLGDFVEEVTVMDRNGDILILAGDKLEFSYRHSNLSEYIILDVKLCGTEKKEKYDIQKEIKKFLDYRKQTQELELPNSGCVFKNPAGDIRGAGELIELSGLKGKRIGDIVVSHKHANFMLNVGKGTAVDFLNLMNLIQNRVKLDHNVWLEPEIRILKS